MHSELFWKKTEPLRQCIKYIIKQFIWFQQNWYTSGWVFRNNPKVSWSIVTYIFMNVKCSQLYIHVYIYVCIVNLNVFFTSQDQHLSNGNKRRWLQRSWLPWSSSIIYKQIYRPKWCYAIYYNACYGGYSYPKGCLIKRHPWSRAHGLMSFKGPSIVAHGFRLQPIGCNAL